MLTFTCDNEKYRMFFKHHKTRNENGHYIPKSTHCYISKNNKILAEGFAKPVNKVPYIINKDENAEEKFGKKLIEVLRMDNLSNKKLAIVRGDMFEYKLGRLYSAKKALKNFKNHNLTEEHEQKIFNEL